MSGARPSDSFIVTVRTPEGRSARIWDASAPLGLGYPHRWVAERTDSGLRVRSLGESKIEAQELGKKSLSSESVVELPGVELRFRPVQATAGRALASFDRAKIEQGEVQAFKRALGATGATLAAVLLLSWVWPQAKPTEELIPAQYAKIVLQKPKVQPTTPKTNGAASAQKTAVAQAFQAKPVQSAVSGLLKGGISKLLAQSELLAAGKSQTAARKIFDNKSPALALGALDTGLLAGKNEKVAVLGGGGQGGSAGYAVGGGAKVDGQGHSLVSMDIGGSEVQEGLTKDEVGEVIHRHMSEVRYCYETALLRSPDLEGKLMVNFVIGGSGQVRSSEVKTSSLTDPRLDQCILQRLNTWKFPNPKGGVDVGVTYPFIFKSLGR